MIGKLKKIKLSKPKVTPSVSSVTPAVPKVSKPIDYSKYTKHLKTAGIIIGGIITIGLAGFFLMNVFSATTCEDAQCFISEANSCKKATFESMEDHGKVSYSSSKCIVTKTFVSAVEGENEEIKKLLEGKSLTCEYNEGEFDENIVNSLILGIENCEGELKDTIGQLIVFA